MKFLAILFFAAVLPTLSRAGCYCIDEHYPDSSIQKKNLVFQGKLNIVREMDTSEVSSHDTGSYLLTFAVDTILSGRGGKTISIRWRRGDDQPCFSRRRGFEVGRNYKIGVYRPMIGIYKPFEKRKNPLYPNEYVPSNVKNYPSFSSCSYVEALIDASRN